MSEIKYKRVLLKLSGEMLGGQEKRGIDISVLDEISNQIKRMLEAKAEVAIVIGAGNFWRGKKEDEIERTTSDYIGMLGTTMNGLALQSRLQKNGIDAILQTAINADAILVGKTIDGVYSDDPKINSAAIKYDNITYQDILNKDLKVMDLTAISLCKENNIPLVVFALQEPENIIKAIKGEKIGTLVN